MRNRSVWLLGALVLVASLIIGLNAFLLFQTFFG